MKDTILLIDWNFFTQRIFWGVGDLKFFDNGSDRREFIKALATSFAAEMEIFKDVITDVWIIPDSGKSWRKNIQPVVSNETRLLLGIDGKKSYKETRQQDEEINWKEFYAISSEFRNHLKEKFQVNLIEIPGLEADDLIAISSIVLNKIGKQAIIWSSDGDLLSLVSQETYYYKLPKRDFYVSKRKHDNLINKDTYSIFSDSITDQLKRITENLNAKPKPVEPQRVMLEKVIMGDAKDNVFPLFNWFPRTIIKHLKDQENFQTLWENGDIFQKMDEISGDKILGDYCKEHKIKKYSPSNSHFNKALNKIIEDDPNTTYQDIIKNPENFIKELLIVTKQKRNIQELIEIFQYNFKVKALLIHNIPDDLKKSSMEKIKLRLQENKKPDICGSLNDPGKILKDLTSKKDEVSENDFFNSFTGLLDD